MLTTIFRVSKFCSDFVHYGARCRPLAKQIGTEAFILSSTCRGQLAILLRKPSRCIRPKRSIEIARPLFFGLHIVTIGLLCGPASAHGLADSDDATERAHGQLPNGLRYLIERRPGAPIAVRLDVAVGEAAEVPGAPVAHLIEHRAFRETRHYPAGSLDRAVRFRFGGYVVGVTSPYNTRYSLILPADTDATVDELSGIMHDWADGVVLTKESVDRERDIILAESRNSIRFSRPAFSAFDQIFGTTRRIDTHQMVQSTATFPFQEAKKFYDHWYRPSLMTIVVVGNVDVAQWRTAIERDFSTLTNPLPAADPPVPKANALPESNSILLFEDSNAANILVESFTATPDVSADWTGANQRDSIIRDISLDIIKSRALRGMRNTGTVDIVVSDGQHIGVGRHDVLALVTISNKEDVKKVISDHHQLVNQIKTYPISAEELRISKMNLKENYINIRSGSDQFSNWYADSFLSNREFEFAMSIDERISALESITLQDISSQTSKFVSGELRTAVFFRPGELSSEAILRFDPRLSAGTPTALPPFPAPDSGYAELKTELQGNASVLRAKLQSILTHQFQLPDRMVLTMADPREVRFGGPELRISGASPEAFANQTLAFKLRSDLPDPSSSVALSPLITGITYEISGSLAALNLRAKPGADRELFVAAGRLLSNPSSITKLLEEAVRPAEANEISEEQLSASIAAWHPTRLTFAGAATPQEVEAFAWENFVGSQASGSQCAVNLEHKGPLYEIEKTMQKGALAISLKLRLPKSSTRAVCLEVLQSILQERVTRILRYEEGLAYSPRVQMTNENVGDFDHINYKLVPDGRPYASPKFPNKISKIWNQILIDLSKNGITDQEISDSRLLISRKKNVKPTVVRDIVDFLDNNYYDEEKDKFESQMISAQDLNGMIRLIFVLPVNFGSKFDVD